MVERKTIHAGYNWQSNNGLIEIQSGTGEVMLTLWDRDMTTCQSLTMNHDEWIAFWCAVSDMQYKIL